ncbi:MAG TPA: cytochrome D1 domain-containing protein [Pyrinomonadaceae bacterium]|nr:cytochrome D1 domain-containing protein [Pyrinomonadaceae bacterium]
MFNFLLLVMAAAVFVQAQTISPKVAKRAAAGRASGEPGPKAPASHTQRFEKEGVRVEFTVVARKSEDGRTSGVMAGADADATFRVTYADTGQPVTGLHPNAWFSARRDTRAPSEGECKDKIRTFAGGLLSVRPEIDLNSYYLLTLNHDNTVTFINPHVAFNRTKLENIVPLPGAGADWALSKDKEFLYITLPEQSAVAVVNTITRKLVSTIPIGHKNKPMRISLDPEGRFVWVGLDGSPEVAVIDATTRQLVANVPAGAGLHLIAFTGDGRYAYVTNSAADTVSVIDARTLKKVSDIPTGKTPVPVAYSSAGGFIYVAAINGTAITVIDPARREVVKSIPVKRGTVALRFDPEGRYAFALNQTDNTVSIIDAATNTIVGTASVVKAPDQVTFTRRYAYIRGTESEKFSLIELGMIGKGKIAPVDVQAGQQPPSTLPGEIGVSDMIVPTPEGNAAMIANAPDAMLYYYVEGMMAPMGTYTNYKRRPRALMILDQSLSEVAPGVYSSPVKLRTAGSFDVPFIIDQPRMVNCFEIHVADSPDAQPAGKGQSIAVQALFKDEGLQVGDAVNLRFKISDGVSGKPLDGLSDVQVLIFEPPGVWQERQWAKAGEPGVYAVTQVFPRAGLYNVLISVPSRGVKFGDLPFTTVPVREKTKPAAPNRAGASQKNSASTRD